MTIRRLLPLLLVLLAPALFARGLDKYKNWPNTPQGYFMTKAERAEWKANVKTDADAEAFVNKFLASRGPGFADEVAKRAGVADQRLTVAGRAGSLTTRGKIVILLGPPSNFGIARRDIHGELTGSPHNAATGSSMSAAGASSSPLGGTSVEDVVDANARAGMSARSVNDYTFTYAHDRLPGKPAKDFTVVVEVDPGDGSDHIVDRKVAAQLDELFEQVAAQQLAAASAPKP